MSLRSPGHPTTTKPALLERLLAVGAHLSSFVAPFLAPLLLWLILRWWLPFAAQHARHALVTHLLTLLTIGVLSLLALAVFLLGLEGTVSVPPAGGTLQAIYLSVFVLLVVAALLAWVVGQISSVSGAIRALQGKPAHAVWRKRH
jgi:uncharacterized Tic20 family protein